MASLCSLSNCPLQISCLLMLHQEHVLQTNAPSCSRYCLALVSTRRVAWDTCKLSIEMMAKHDIAQLSYVTMNCTFRAVLALVDDIGHSLLVQDVKELLPTLRRFSERWVVGGMNHKTPHSVFVNMT